MVFIGCPVKAQKQKPKPQFMEGVFYVKLKPENRALFISRNLNPKWENVSKMFTVRQTFKNSEQLSSRGSSNTKKVDLNLIYTLSVNNSHSSTDVVKLLETLNIFEYVEPKRIRSIDFTPNDTKLSQQYYLAQINAYSAWDITQGNTAIKIGIIDTGTDLDHPDLETQMAENSADPVNGIDDDNDGYVDNFNGWDFMDNDHEPQADESSHGIHVAGIAAAATNNTEGVAGVGFNTQFLPIRAANGSQVIYGYEGIVYAADMGCDIINCSWGGFGYSKFEEDIINYATYNKDALVVCAAGNSDKNQPYYPAAYENALAVSSINYLDNKSSFTNHGYWVDIAATGEGIYATWKDGGYNSNTGTSMASPVVAGAAGLVLAKFPQLSALQVKERLIATSFNIDGINAGYEYKLGAGRIDVNAAISGAITQASVVFGNVKVSNGNDNVFKIGDSIFISGTFTNYLAQSANVNVSVTSLTPSVTVNHSTENLGVMAASLQKNNYNSPFSFKVLNTANQNENAVFRIDITDGFFHNTYFVEALINVDYLNIAVNQLAATVGSKGQFGYNGREQRNGLGMKFNNGVSQLFEGGLMIGTNQLGYAQAVDRIRNQPGSYDDDFASVQNVSQGVNLPNADYFLSGVFNDSLAYVDSIGVQVSYTGYASNEVGHQNYIVLEYTVVNKTVNDFTDINIGLFADFDVANFDHNQAHTDWIRFLTYTENTTENVPVFGVQLLSQNQFNSYCFDLIPGGGGGGDITQNYSSNNKVQSMKNIRYHSGVGSNTGNDVAQVTSAKGISILAGDSVTVAFALHAADNVFLIQRSADSAYYRYNGALPNSVNEIENFSSKIKVYPNPVQKEVTIDASLLAGKGAWSFKVYDSVGKIEYNSSMIYAKPKTVYNTENLSAGVYFVEIQMGRKTYVTKLIKNP